MTPDITIKRNDVGKVLSGQFTDADGAAVNCTTATSAKLFMRQFANRSATPKINGATFMFSNAATGSWTYTLTASDVDTSGTYYLEWELGFPGGVKQTFPTHPDSPYKVVLIQRDLG